MQGSNKAQKTPFLSRLNPAVRLRATELSSAGRMPEIEDPPFWVCAAALDGAITFLVARDVLLIGCVAAMWVVLHTYYPAVHLQVVPAEIAGGALGLMLVFRNNGGYERWWEGRKLWGQITNSVRGLVQCGLAYGPKDPAWQQAWVHWCASYPHACRLSLRGERVFEDFERLLGQKEADQLRRVPHMPSFVSYRMASLIAEAGQNNGLSPSALISMEAARQSLVDAIGACERIVSTPLPRIYVIKIRRFIAIYAFIFPAALVERAGWITPLLAMLVAYSALGLDRIAEELQAPFNPKRLNHLPLEAMCRAIEGNSLGMLAQVQDGGLPGEAMAAEGA